MSVDITVSIDSNNNITVIPDPAPSGHGRNIPFKWTIVTNGWTFTSKGIDIPNNGGQFSGGNSTAQGRQFHWVDKNDNTNPYKYDVNVTNGTTTLNRDPTIQNQGDGR